MEYAVNKRARYDYDISDTYEAGIVLAGHEVKSIKTGHLSLKGSFVVVRSNEIYLINALIPHYKHAANVTDYEPTRSRKLLLHKSQIKTLIGKKQVEGLTLVPIRVYIKKRHIKLLFGIGKGKKKHDKRQTKGKADAKRKIDRALRSKQ